jgi:indolepyruvate ferredoxin oxidoreductase beta subunit
MTYNIILAGVGGQGVLSLATVIAAAADRAGLKVRQSEVHGMAQRGGSVLAHLRISDRTIHSDLVPRGRADLILAMEPLEALRYTDYLSAEGAVVSGIETIRNIDSYPEIGSILSPLRSIAKHRLINTADLARQAGHPKSANLVLVGAASAYLPLDEATVKASIGDIFGRKGAEMVALNVRAFDLGKSAPEAAGDGMEAAS